jgi:sugar lactone lactonase YvrE
MRLDMRAGKRFASIVVTLGITVAACSKDGADRGAAADSADRRDSAAASGGAGSADTLPARITDIANFKTPESVKYDAELDRYYVSNINGNPSNKDGNGYIATVKPDSTGITMFIEGGKNGVTLNAPKGMAIVGDTLWVADIDAARAFNRRTGAPIRSVELGQLGVIFANDIAPGPDSAIYLTDTGIRFGSDGAMTAPGKHQIIRIAGTRATVALEGEGLSRPNGIAWDNANSRFVIAPFGGKAVLTWTKGDPAPAPLASGPGQYDGIEVLGDGRVLVSSWADSSVQVISNGQMTKLIGSIEAPADIGYDTMRHRVLIPMFNGNRVQVWTSGRR